MRPDHLPAKDGWEQDWFTSWRHVYKWRPGQGKEIKNRHNRRVRKGWKSDPSSY